MPVGSRRGHRVWNTHPPGGELVDDVVCYLTLVLAQAPEPAVVNIAFHDVPPWDGADSFRWMVRSSDSGIWQRIR